MSGHIANDKKFGRKVFRYHPRSDEHSKVLCRLILDDLLLACPLLAKQVRDGLVVGGVNAPFTFANGKNKTLDLAIGTPVQSGQKPLPGIAIAPGPIRVLRFSCEAKQCMTEHSKTKPRIFDELSSSHEIVHQGDTQAIAAGIVMVNIANAYASPTRQTSGDGPLIITKHKQPDVTMSIVEHLCGLVMRAVVGEVGFDALATIVVNCDNTGPCTIHTEPPSPQPGELHHYDTFVECITRAYADRFPA